MNTRWNKQLAALLLIGAAAVMTPQQARAITPACTSVVNNATLTYTVDSIDLTKDTTDAPATFTVGNKVMLTVEKVDGAAVTVIPGSSATELITALDYLTFTVTNEGNALQDYSLSVISTAGLADPFGGIDDNFSLDGVAVYVDVNNDLVYDAGDTETAILALDPTAQYGTNLELGQRTVFIVPTGDPAVLTSQLNGDQAVYALEAVSLPGDGAAGTTAAEAQNSNATIYQIGGGTCTADIVLAEDVHSTNVSSEVHWDGKDNARNTFLVETAALTISKTPTPIWDPVNWNNNPKAIPGGLYRYEITVTNAAGSALSATLTEITDSLVGSLLFDPDLKSQNLNTDTPTREYLASAGYGFKALLTGGTRDGSGGGLQSGVAKYYTTAAGDGIDISGQDITATLATLLPAQGGTYGVGELKAGESLTITFNVEIL